MEIIWIILIAAGLLTYLTRLSFIALLGKWTLPGWMRRALRYVPPAVLTAILMPELLVRDSHIVLLNPRVLAGGLAALVAWRTRNIILTIAIGMAALLLIQVL